MSLKGTVLFLQILSGVLIAMGVCGLIGSLMSPRPVLLFGMLVPAGMIATTVVGVGVYYWLRAIKLKHRIASGSSM